MDQGLKERLVGAAVLVAIGVWLIPWVLDGPENTVDTSVSSLQLPAAEEPMPMRTQTLRLGNQAEELEPPASDPQSVPAEPPPVAGAERSERPAAVTAREPAAETETLVPADPPVRVATAPPPTPPPAARTAPAAAQTGDWVVQLGSFGEEANARRLAQRVGTFGYKGEVSSLRSSGRTLYRVRVGPTSTRAQADATASALRAHGVEARVVAADR
jgi:DedD protein